MRPSKTRVSSSADKEDSQKGESFLFVNIKDSNERQSELREGAEAEKFCKRQRLEVKLEIAVKRDRARHFRPSTFKRELE